MNQHYVPRVYLKNFAVQKGSEYHIDVYSKSRKEVFSTNIKNICTERELYTLTELEGDELPGSVEKFYSDFQEPIYQRTYEILTNQRITKISEYDRVEIIMGIFQFYFRNPLFLKLSAKIHINRIKSLENSIKEANKSFSYLEVEYITGSIDYEKEERRIYENLKSNFKKIHIQAFQELSSNQYNMSINVWKQAHSYRFFSSDKPLYHTNVFDKKNQNVFNPEGHFYLPLDHQHLVFLYHDKTKRKDRIYRQNVYKLKGSTSNASQFNNADEFVFGKKAYLEEYIKEIEFMNQPISEESLFTSLDSLVRNFPVTKENKKILTVARKHLEIRKSMGKWTKAQMHQVFLDITKINKQHFKKKL